ncbi:MAG TPA: hypothetical protein VH062_15650 [Polyangiaceae bacterium]|nr:hypothetical protein [Polyangiaceae bacterium]
MQASPAVAVISAALSSADIRALAAGTPSTLSYDLYAPTPPTGLPSVGVVNLFVSSPSSGVLLAFAGTADLSTTPTNEFVTQNMKVPAAFRQALLGNHTDLRVTFLIDTPPNSGRLLLSNVRFGS